MYTWSVHRHGMCVCVCMSMQIHELHMYLSCDTYTRTHDAHCVCTTCTDKYSVYVLFTVLTQFANWEARLYFVTLIMCIDPCVSNDFDACVHVNAIS